MKIEFLDTTLRDGAQASGISFSVRDKHDVLTVLDNLGIDLIEGGDPYSNPKDAEFFAEENNDKLVAFGSTHRPNLEANNDEGLCSLLKANTKTVCIFGKASASQVKDVLCVPLEKNLEMIGASVAFLHGAGKRVIFDAEHFFDGYKENKTYALSVLFSAYSAGADTIVLCDTNGSSSPSYIGEVTKKISDMLDGARIGIHAHNDCGMAVANAISAVENGATHVQGTFLGFGERCGNANLSTIIANLALKFDYDVKVNLERLTPTAHAVAEICNIKLDASMPYVGAAAFAHKGGMHSDAVIKSSSTFEHISPEIVGNKERILLSEVAGRSAIVKKLSKLFPDLEKSDPKTKEILDMVKVLEMKGYQFENADGSFILLAEKMMGARKPSFTLDHYTIHAVKPDGINTAEVSIKVGDAVTTVTKDGNGPVNALDKALRAALVKHFPEIENVALVDYKVRVVNSSSATGAVVRVLITSTDKHETWTTIGVSPDIIEASWSALVDSLEYKLTGQCAIG